MEKRLRSSLKSSADEFLSSAAKLGFQSVKTSLKTLIYSLKPSSDVVSSLPLSLHQSISQSITRFKDLSGKGNTGDASSLGASSPVTPASKRVRRSSRQPESNRTDGKDDASGTVDEKTKLNKVKSEVSENLQVYAHVAHLCVTHPGNVFSASDLLPAVQELHDNLVVFELESNLLSEIASLCEEWWKRELPGRDCLITQSLPFLVSKSLTLKKKVNVHRVYALREAFTLFDFEDESIEDLKLLLIRCLISPLYLKMDEGRRFLAFLFGLSRQLVKESLAMIRSQIPFGRKSMLEAYADIVFRAWKAAEGESREEIENDFLQALVDSSIHATTGSFAASIRRILGGFITQRTTDGVEKLIFNLTEPVIFRSLQVANSNVRQNALHLLIDVFPLEDPDLTREAKDTLLHKQFFLIEKLIMDDCPDTRAVAVEGICRILYMFWEIIPSSTITKLLTKLLDDMAHDMANMVRLSTVNGIIYLLGNPQSHEILKVLLPRLGHLILDSSLSIRSATVDLLLLLKGIHDFQFHKVVNLDVLLSTLANDQPLVAQKITKLLLPSYFPTTVTLEEACQRCVTLIKRSPLAGARFCEFSFSEGASPQFLNTLFKVLINLILSPHKTPLDQIEGILMAASNICNNLATEPKYKSALKDELTGKKLISLLSAAKTAHAQASVFKIVLTVLPDAASVLRQESMAMVTRCVGLSENKERQTQMRLIHKMMMSCGWIDDMIQTLTRVLQKTANGCVSKHNSSSSSGKKRKVKHGSVKSKHMSGKNHPDTSRSSFFEDYTVCVGVAWQLKDLLTDVNTRKAVLESRNLESAFHALKIISEFVIECLQSNQIDTSPVSTYTSLILHMSLKNSTGISTETIEHLLQCTEKLYKTNASRKSSKENGSSFEEENRISNIVKLSTSILKFINDSNTLTNTNNHQETCLRFTRQYLGFIILNLRKHSHGILEFKEEDIKETFLCLKTSFTYSAKLLNLILTTSSESTQLSVEIQNLSNDMFDFVVSMEEHMGGKYGSLLFSVVKSWLPDLILSFGCSQPQPPLSPPLWVVVLGKIEVFEVDLGDENEKEKVVLSSKFCMFKKVVERMVKLLRGNKSVMDVVGGFLLNLEFKDFGMLFGVLNFVCGKMVKHENGEWGEMKIMLECVGRIYPWMVRMCEECGDEGEKEWVERGRVLLEPIWRCYVDDGTNEPMETGFEDVNV
ncbi:unnamed protein product [Lactuca virosa]|uniref:Condensin complex subunit 1 C-terminal domain-containing protein n=1 Tax=Lactuca virosa TaxID=75947 RepID=A0AAU9MAS9_9ASTR|nr:unnamed protein product [Lactuca virosa]